MRIAISATAQTLDAEVDPRFGRCQCFIINDPEKMEFEVVENSSAMAAGGKRALCPSGSRYAEGSDKRLPGDGKGAMEKGLPQTLRRRVDNAAHSFSHR